MTTLEFVTFTLAAAAVVCFVFAAWYQSGIGR